jgi:hypothetical protein
VKFAVSIYCNPSHWGSHNLSLDPEGPVACAQMAIYLLRFKHGASYAPPALKGSTVFTDVDPTY